MNVVNLISKTPDRYEIRESFRTLRTNILFSGSDIKTIAITSSTQNEGKSFVALEVSKSLAAAGKKVLFLDADLRKSVIADKHVADDDLIGLSHYLSGQADADQIIYATQHENFHIVFSGPFPPNPVELIGSRRFTDMLQYYRSVFDYIIVDTPPLGLVIDAAVISAACDGVIINVAANKVSHRIVKSIKQQLERSGCHIIGAVLNMADNTHSSGYKNYMSGSYKDYNESYGYYGKKHNLQKHYVKLSNDQSSESDTE